jgi:hypothetical protein
MEIGGDIDACLTNVGDGGGTIRIKIRNGNIGFFLLKKLKLTRKINF